ncbi:hypothetical protein BJ878DRAFT_559497 [Calycina marina]|uniref:DUF7702 domain-containing protein n=1 Tax=Calycina marina TaxID=1763456 RepID=A0A9P8CIQ6_9HELO|nr:hypothetical protein BJ878DRAFT_559497 [Calycina marina]
MAVYTPSMAVAVLLMFRHGFNKSAGWYFIVIFYLASIHRSLRRLIITQSIELSPLYLATLGLLGRLLTDIQRTTHTAMKVKFIKFIELILLVALILGIMGGVNNSSDLIKTGVYKVATESKVASALFIFCYIGIVVSTILISLNASHASPGEKRILLSIAVSLPFLLVRLLYSVISTFSHGTSFNILSRSVAVLVCVAMIEEFIIIIVYEGTGLTL